ncbi:MAG: sigma-70 family RNA polymerase sigma factor [Turicibacter sp.]|nr:sigma-70 family RNA polymerase sigma factor [Turicibacter sp.]
MTKDEIRALIARAQEKDEQALADLVNGHIDLVWSVVHKFPHNNADIEDLFQVGCSGLLKAIEGFNPAFDTTLSTYAIPLIMGEIKAYLRSLSPVKVSRQIKMNAYRIAIAKDAFIQKNGHEPTIAELAVLCELDEDHVILAMNAPTHATSLDHSENDDTPLFERLVDSKEKVFDEEVVLKELVGGFGKREQTLLYLRYDLGLTQSEVAARLSMNQVAVSRLEKKVLMELRGKMS